MHDAASVCAAGQGANGVGDRSGVASQRLNKPKMPTRRSRSEQLAFKFCNDESVRSCAFAAPSSIDPEGALHLSQRKKRAFDARAEGSYVKVVTFCLPARRDHRSRRPQCSGETTTINMILGVLDASDGSFFVAGLDVAKHRPEALATSNSCPAARRPLSCANNPRRL